MPSHHYAWVHLRDWPHCTIFVTKYFPDDTFINIFLNENVWISIKTSLKFIPKVHVNNIPALVQIMAWRYILLTHVCVTRPQWVNLIWLHNRSKPNLFCNFSFLFFVSNFQQIDIDVVAPDYWTGFPKLTICFTKQAIMGSDNGLLRILNQLTIGPLVTFFVEMWIKILYFSYNKMHFSGEVCQMADISSRPQCINDIPSIFDHAVLSTTNGYQLPIQRCR